MKRIILPVLALCLLCLQLPVLAQSYPNKPVKVIVTTVPGPLDTFARMIMDKVSLSMKQPFVIENRAGAGGNIGADLVAKSFTGSKGSVLYTAGLTVKVVSMANSSV